MIHRGTRLFFFWLNSSNSFTRFFFRSRFMSVSRYFSKHARSSYVRFEQNFAKFRYCQRPRYRMFSKKNRIFRFNNFIGKSHCPENLRWSNLLTKRFVSAENQLRHFESKCCGKNRIVSKKNILGNI